MALAKPQVVETAADTITAEGVAETQTAQVDVVVDEPAADQAVAVAKQASAPTVTEQRTNAMAQFSQEQAAAGFEGLDLTGMSFDRVKLHEGTFKLGSEDADIGNSFDCVIHSTRRLFVVRQSDDQDAKAYYSYDSKGDTLTDGSSAAEIKQEWLEDGYGTADSPLDIKEYLEAMAVLVNREDEFEGQMVMLSIPPASKAKLSGAAAQAFTKMNKALLSDVVTRCIVGKQLGEGTKKFRPWVFQVTGRYEG
ncbi:hypothetical protein OF001_U20327 [Pseudomonas sp. OF001]|uniref:hypothetical protein n=1 Tax=Pseudomonas sp. OF001 TaxID=2772300 RepID=UPI0019188CBC|nr:hypothetical protein [Pseudomonas sp. OF001]CAD5377400.1 hypothetical protein OF001_U20327 [Pseudomonas sp. OF001]